VTRPVFTEQAAKDPTGGWQERLASLSRPRHPVVRVHPETGERALFVNPAFTTRLDGFRPEENEPILRLLHEHIAQAEHVVRWHRREGDIAFWDNRATAHYVVTNYDAGHRRMPRVTVAGDRPYGPRDLTPEQAVSV
jgi:alpha-ketoglutarate-dependent taurine dioxygenase